MRRFLVIASVLVSASLALAPAAIAHHSTANYDRSKVVQITGVVAEFFFVNPHALLLVDVTRDDGLVEQYSVFLTGKASMLRTGWTPDSVAVGDEVTIFASPDRTDPHEVYLWLIAFADGSEWNFADIVGQSVGARIPDLTTATDVRAVQ